MIFHINISLVFLGLFFSSLLWVEHVKAAEQVYTLEQCFEPLKEPVPENALLALNRLSLFAATQNEQGKRLSAQLANLIRGLFSAEFQMKAVVAASHQAINESELQRQEEDARRWLIPNSLGSINRTSYENAMRAIQKKREEGRQLQNLARQEIEFRRASLALRIKEANELLPALEKECSQEVAAVVRGCVNAVGNRSLGLQGSDVQRNEEIARLIALGIVVIGAAAIISSSPGAPPNDPDEGQWKRDQAFFSREYERKRRENQTAISQGQPPPNLDVPH